jgi:alpha-D-ribose 1-methylphosphonate 5-triphosphate diphosphatase PhnM
MNDATNTKESQMYTPKSIDLSDHMAVVERDCAILEAGVTLTIAEISEMQQRDDWTVEDAIEMQAMFDMVSESSARDAL